VILEYARLSDITGDRKYADLAGKAENHLLKPQPASGEPYPGLLGSFVNVATGEIIGSQGSWGALADCKIWSTTTLIKSSLTTYSFLRVPDKSISIQQ
jgi:hypothetical protein